MKNLLIILSLSFVYACGFQSNEATAYNNVLLLEQQSVANQMKTYLDMLKDTNQLVNLLDSKNNLINEIKKSSKEVNKLKEYNGNIEFKNSVINVLETYSSCIENEYNDIAQYQLLPLSERTQDKFYSAERKAFLADEKIEKAENVFIENQKEFALANGFSLD